MKLESFVKRFIPRRTYFADGRLPDYLESDKDFVLNNLEICVQFLEELENTNR